MTDNIIFLLMFFSMFCLFLAIAELLALSGVKLAISIMCWYDDMTTRRHIRKNRRFWKRVNRGEI